MLSEKFQHQFRIPSARAIWHDYNGGVYFVTICTAKMAYFFGNIEYGNMNLSDIGKYAAENLENIAKHYPYCEIPLFVVMPNHIHLIAFIDGNDRRDVACRVSDETSNANIIERGVARHTQGDAARHTQGDAARHVSTTEGKNKKMQEISKKQGLLSVVIGGFKSAITRYANENDIAFGWQTRFHERIIRNQNECNRIADYIENNVALWDTDCFNISTSE